MGCKRSRRHADNILPGYDIAETIRITLGGVKSFESFSECTGNVIMVSRLEIEISLISAWPPYPLLRTPVGSYQRVDLHQMELQAFHFERK